MQRLKWTGVSNKRMLPAPIKSVLASCSAASLLLLCHAATADSWQPLPEQLLGVTTDLSPAAPATCRSPEQPEAIQVWLPLGRSQEPIKTLSQWPAHPLAEFVQCFHIRWYQDYDELDCRSGGQRGHQQCDLALLPREWNQRQLVFIASGTPAIGSASHWQMVLPVDASVDILAHEVGHWLGFADEYPMSAALAENYCQGRYLHPSVNVVTTVTQQLSSHELQKLWQRLPWRDAVADWRDLAQPGSDGKWQLGSAASVAVGLFPSATCNAVEKVYSWKPVAHMTAMEYHDVNVWPEVYLELLRRSNGQ